MEGYQKKTRIVSFRASEDEYQLLQLASALDGSQNLSDFTRRVTLEHAAGRCGLGGGANEIALLEDKLAALEQRVLALPGGSEE